MIYPQYSRPERIADAAMHVAGIIFAFAGAVLLLIWAAQLSDDTAFWGLSVYSMMLVASFVASALYHFTPWEEWRGMLRRIDHAAIYLKIAGTYTPLVVLIGSTFAYGILTIVWALAVVGVIAKLFFWNQREQWDVRWGTALYLGMGWLSVALLTSLASVISSKALTLMAIGGVIYTMGAVLLNLKDLRYQFAIWHGFVLVASICFFIAIFIGVFPDTDRS